MRRAVALAVLALTALLATPAAPQAAAAPAGTPKVLLVLVPDLRWSDVAAMPTLRALMDRGAVGVLSVKTQGAATRCADGLLEISAMTRVPSGVDSCALDAARLAQLRDRYRRNRYDAHVGLLGDLAGRRLAAADDAAAVVAATSSRLPTTAAADVTIRVDDGLYSTTGDRVAAAAQVDGNLARATSGLPASTIVMVAGSSDGATGGPELHPVVVAGPGWPHRALTSPSTGRAPYVQLFDVGPTLLGMLGVVDLPASVSGRPMHASGTAVGSVAAYVDLDRHARRALDVGHPTFTGLCVALLVALLLAAVGRREAAWVARLLVAAPVATWLVQVVPWWRWPIAAYAVVVAAIGIVGAFVWRWVPAVTAVVLLGDQVLGARLQQAAPLGDNPLVAGRFHGMGNIAFGVAMGAVLVCAAASRRWRVAAALAAVAVVIDGAPMLGDDLGGLLALVPAAVVLVALLAGARLDLRRTAFAVAAAAAVVLVAAAADYSRPARSQTHVGRFVGQVLHGGAWRVLHRKADAVLGSFDNPVVAVTVVAVLAAAALLLARRRRPDALVVAAVVLGVLGSALNDSGIFVGAAVALVVAPALLGVRRGDNRSL